MGAQEAMPSPCFEEPRGAVREVTLGFRVEQARREAAGRKEGAAAPYVGACPKGNDVPRHLAAIADGCVAGGGAVSGPRTLAGAMAMGRRAAGPIPASFEGRAATPAAAHQRAARGTA